MAPLDPSILNHLPDLGEAAQHLLDGAGDRLGQAGANGLVRVIGGALNRVFGRGGGADLKIQRDRVETTIAALISDLEEHGLTSRLDVESMEPSATTFVADALEDAAASPSEGKRALLGRMIARRLSSSTESFYELSLRDARRIAAGFNDQQLMLLATLLLTSATPLPRDRLPTPADIAAFFTETFDAALDLLANGTWSRSDVEKLTADGAITEVSADELAPTRQDYHPPRFSLAERIWHEYGSTCDALSFVHQRVRELFTVDDYPEAKPRTREPIGDLWLLPPGAIIAALVLEAHVGRRIVFAEWEGLEHSEISPSALIAPFSSPDLNSYAAQQRGNRSDALWERIKKQAPKALAEDLKRTNPFGFGV